jgi:putative transposase
MNSPTNKQKVDPIVECLIKLFPEDFIRAIAQETGFIQRQRKIDPVIFFWVIVLGFGVNFLRTIRGLKRKYENESNIEITISSFNDLNSL